MCVSIYIYIFMLKCKPFLAAQPKVIKVVVQ